MTNEKKLLFATISSLLFKPNKTCLRFAPAEEQIRERAITTLRPDVWENLFITKGSIIFNCREYSRRNSG
jgi:hypothetical protein